MRASTGAVWFGLGMLVGGQAPAAEPANPGEQSPDIELLEYLGDLVLEQGRWVGPDDMKGAADAHEAPTEADVDDVEG